RIKRQQMGTTQNLGESSLLHSNEPAQTNRLGPDIEEEMDKPQTKPLANNPLKPAANPSPQDKPEARPFIDKPAPVRPLVNKGDPLQTRNLDEMALNDLRPPQTKPFVDDNPAQPAPNIDRFQTRNLQDDAHDEPKAGTRILPDMLPENYPVDTRRLDQEEDSPQTRNLGRPQADQYGTRPLDMEAPPPPTPPEFSSLDLVLQSFGMVEPEPDEMDTPSVPTKDSDALRQFIATNSGDFDAESFDDVLGAIEPDNPEAPKKQRQVDFEGLVKSMQRDEPQRRLPDRQQQQLLDFVLTTGMDSVLQEIEKTKTGHLPKLATPPPTPQVQQPPSRPQTNSSFGKLAQEEPPLPTLEENGTVSDLLVGISDSNFRDVLALLNEADGIDTPEPKPKPKPIAPPEPRKPDVTYFDDFLQTTTIDSDSIPVAQPRPARENYDFSFDYNDDDDGATVAGVVLRSTQENTSMPGEFSLDQLMSDINDRLTTHKLKVRPLPSWDMDTTAFHAPVTDTPQLPTIKGDTTIRRRPGEPSFLPEMFPPDEIVPRELPVLESNEAASEVWTTRASEPSLETIEPVDENDETMVEPGYFDETIVNEPVTTIDADMFSGILDEAASYDEAPRYDEDAESSSNQTTFDWNEPDLTVEIEPTEGEFTAPYYEADLEPAPVDDFDTRTTVATSEQNGDDFSTIVPEETFSAEVVQAEDNGNWEPNWNTPEVAAEPAIESFNDAWDELAAEPSIQAEPVVENVDNGWDVPQVEAEPVVESFNDAWGEPAAVETPSAAQTEEARIAQLALNLTQVSLEVSAEGTILTRNNQIIALAGHLSQQDAIELGTVINNDWGTGGQGARLRFITLPSSGKEYMLYSTGTEEDLILSMIFAGSTPLRVIRQQGQRLIKALGEVPEVKPTTAISPAPRRDLQGVEEALEPYAYVWLVRDPEQPLNSAIAQSITAGLMTQLSELNWKIEQLQVQDEYIYLYANVPGETPSYAVIRELKQRAANIAQKQDSNLEAQGLWADSYLVLSPGRELAPDE
ncbi:MAG: transposase, partial [Chloroflexota bacterium]